MKYLIPIVVLIFISTGCQDEVTSTAVLSDTDRLIQRALEHELDTDYSPPPGDALSHHAAGFAKVLCSVVFVTGLEAEFVAENIGYFSARYEERAKFSKWSIHEDDKYAEVTLPNGIKGQAVIIPSHDMVVVNMSPYKGAFASGEDLKQAFEVLMAAIPENT